MRSGPLQTIATPLLIFFPKAALSDLESGFGVLLNFSRADAAAAAILCRCVTNSAPAIATHARVRAFYLFYMFYLVLRAVKLFEINALQSHCVRNSGH